MSNTESEVILLNREETCNHILSVLKKKQNIVVTRYSDGEYYLMRGEKVIWGTSVQNSSYDIAAKLHSSISNPDNKQLICINEIKEHNRRNKDKWVIVHDYLINACKKSLYGAANWNIYDYCNTCSLLPYFFKGRVLFIVGQIDLVKTSFAPYLPDASYYKVPLSKAFDFYSDVISDLRTITSENMYDNIIISCGPVAKAFASDLMQCTTANIVDMGGVINALIDPNDSRGLLKSWTGGWTMSWTRQQDLPRLTDRFFENISMYNMQGE